MGDKIKVEIDPDLIDLIPGYLENRQKDIEAIKQGLAESDYETIRTLGHRMKGSGGGYGFQRISEIGKQIEEAAVAGRNEEVNDQLNELQDYLAKVEPVEQV